MQRRIIVSEFDSRESRDDANQGKMFLNRLKKAKKSISKVMFKVQEKFLRD